MSYVDVPGAATGWICQRCGASHGPTASSCWCQPGQAFVGTGTSFAPGPAVVPMPPSAAAVAEIASEQRATMRVLGQIEQRLAALEKAEAAAAPGDWPEGARHQFERANVAVAEAQKKTEAEREKRCAAEAALRATQDTLREVEEKSRRDLAREKDDRRAAEAQCAAATAEARALSSNLSPLLRAADACLQASRDEDYPPSKTLVKAVADAFVAYAKGMEKKP